jgi:hypothetical protein
MKNTMQKSLSIVVAAFGLAASVAQAQTPLSAYADARGYVDVQALTCAQLAGTYQEDADMLAAWYSGWYNGLAQKHYAHITRAKSGEHELILYCKAHPELKIIQAIDNLLKMKSNFSPVLVNRGRDQRGMTG